MTLRSVAATEDLFGFRFHNVADLFGTAILQTIACESQGSCDAPRFTQFQQAFGQPRVPLRVCRPITDELAFFSCSHATEHSVVSIPTDHFSLKDNLSFPSWASLSLPPTTGNTLVWPFIFLVMSSSSRNPFALMVTLLSCGVFPFLHKFKDVDAGLYDDKYDDRYPRMISWFLFISTHAWQSRLQRPRPPGRRWDQERERRWSRECRGLLSILPRLLTVDRSRVAVADRDLVRTWTCTSS